MTIQKWSEPLFFFTFDLEMCFAPQQRALFRHLNFQKWSETVSFWHFWLGNVLRASSRHNGVQFFISHLASWLRTRRFSEVISTVQSPKSLEKHSESRLSYVSRTCIFLLPTLSLLWSSHFLTSPPWLFPPLLFHLSILSEVWLLNFLRLWGILFPRPKIVEF